MYVERGFGGATIRRYFDDEDYGTHTTAEERMWDSLHSFHLRHYACSTPGYLYPSIFKTYERFVSYVRDLCKEASVEFVEPVVAWQERQECGRDQARVEKDS